MEPWYKNTVPRAEVREGRSFNPDEFAIALEQVAANKGPEDYRDPAKFFARTCFTRALREHMGMVLRRLAGRTDNSAPVMTLVTQFGGGKTHTLTALYHLAKHGSGAKGDPGVAQLLSDAGLTDVPTAKVAVFVGNAWDPGRGTRDPVDRCGSPTSRRQWRGCPRIVRKGNSSGHDSNRQAGRGCWRFGTDPLR